MSKYTSKSSKKQYRRKASKAPRRALKKSKPTAKKFTPRQLAQYVSAVKAKRGESEE